MIYSYAGEHLTQEELGIMIKEADLDGDSEISFAGACTLL